MARKPFGTARPRPINASGVELRPSAPEPVTLVTVTAVPQAAAMEHAAGQATRNSAASDHALPRFPFWKQVQVSKPLANLRLFPFQRARPAF